MGDNLLVIDEGTTSTRSMLFAPDGRCLGTAQQALTLSFPEPGWVEQDAEEIWSLSMGEKAKLGWQPAGTGSGAAQDWHG